MKKATKHRLIFGRAGLGIKPKLSWWKVDDCAIETPIKFVFFLKIIHLKNIPSILKAFKVQIEKPF